MNKQIILQIKPLRDNDHGVDHWIAFLRNLWSITSPINLWITGNNNSIKLYISSDRKNTQFIENMFYANYPSSELIETNTTVLKPANEFVIISKKTIIREISSYKKWETYMSPLHDVLSLYNTVDNESEFTIQISLQLKKNKTVLDHAWEIIKNILFPEKAKEGWSDTMS